MQPAPVSTVPDVIPQPPPSRHPTRTSSFPIQSVSPKEMVLPTCQEVRDAGMRTPPSRPFIPSYFAHRLPPTPRKSRGHSVASSPSRPTRTSSLPVQSVSPQVSALHICQWVGDDGMPCGAQITRADLSQHLTTHDIKDKAHDYRLLCRWLGCRLRGDKHMIKRESILRHILERHMGYRRVATN
ncbi:hypothetical protein HD554DRAFT_1161425 [Boletus coccyginus]|nr:hypothetical protein HD554DRAFT_1161425 [Boletus coccyginus]